jgi:hypothetical protein
MAWDAAAPPSSQVFMLPGALLIIPVILMYTAWSYYVLIPSPLKPRNIRPSVRIKGRAWLAGRALRRQIHKLR